ncbi:MAG: DUF1574 family protein [Cyanobacteria bacterium SZAS LIN-2]|nr:DUF1574 family protein [Cyanobacteria bacterium SZAS LIN-3]MBS1996587.1 DUF1574 family protein [Cyanobacteria bacterium SZAS LIN-2]
MPSEEANSSTPGPLAAGKGRGARLVVSSVFVAVLLLAVLDVTFGYLHPLKGVKTVGLDRGEPFNASSAVRKGFASDARLLKSGKQLSEVVLLGSSLVVAPSLQSESTYQARPLERFNNRRLTSFEEYLKEALNTGGAGSAPGASPEIRSYLLASGGAMASDAYFVEKNVVLDAPDNGRHLAIIYGIGPRDFQDNLFPRVDSSNIFQVLGRIDDLPTVFKSEPKISFEDRGSIFMSRLSSLMRYREDLLRVLAVRSKRVIEKLVPGVMFEKYSDTLVLKRQKEGLFPEEAQGTPLVYPNLAIDHNDWTKTNFEYIRRYNPIDESKSQTQFAYFERFLKLAADRHISVLVVNMPISKSNKGVIPPGFYDRYLATTRDLCKKYGADYSDFNVEPWCEDKNFVDSVHLIPQVSQAFMRDLARTAAHSGVSIATVQRGRSL